MNFRDPVSLLVAVLCFRLVTFAAGFVVLMGWVDILAISSDSGAMRYPGGKNGAGVGQRIINLMPPHRVYIEPFAGSGAILRMKKPAAENIALDLDQAAAYQLSIFCAARRLPAVQVVQGDGIGFLEQYKFRGDELVYCDPPYLHATRTWEGLDLYRGQEMSDATHRRLLKVLRRIRGMVMVSGYRSQMYDTALTGWESEEFTAYTRQGDARQEVIWFNFARPVALHDYSFLGADFRERERIKRKKLRWASRLRRLDHMERQALLSVIEQEWLAGKKLEGPLVKSDGGAWQASTVKSGGAREKRPEVPAS